MQGDLLYGIFTPVCFDQIFTEYKITKDCFSFILSKGLGYGIIVGSLIVKVPQIIKILTSKSGRGLNLLSIYVELLGFFINLAYSFHRGFPLSTYGEYVFMSVQDYVILLLIYRFEKLSMIQFSGATMLSGSLLYGFFSGLIPMEVISTLQAANMFILIGSRVPQIWQNHKSKNTGQLSVVTYFLQFVGCCARVFTTIRETKDPLLASIFGMAVLLNGTLFLQILAFRAPTKAKKSKKEA